MCSRLLLINQQTQDSDLGLFPNAQNVLVTGGTFVSLPRRLCKGFNNNCTYFICQNIVNILLDNTDERRMKIPVPQKPRCSPNFTGRKDILDKLGKIFVYRANSRLISRRSCLLWGMGGIGKTQICLKFMEEMCDR